MPCRDYESVNSVSDSFQIDRLTNLLCEATSLITEGKINASKELLTWMEGHRQLEVQSIVEHIEEGGLNQLQLRKLVKFLDEL